MAIICYFARYWLVSIFTRDPDLLEVATSIFRILCISIVFDGANAAVEGPIPFPSTSPCLSQFTLIFSFSFFSFPFFPDRRILSASFSLSLLFPPCTDILIGALDLRRQMLRACLSHNP